MSVGRVFLLSTVVSLLLCATAVAQPEPARGKAQMPPNQMLIMNALHQRGVIPSDATELEAMEIYEALISEREAFAEDRLNPLAAEQLQGGERRQNPVNTHGRTVRPNNPRFDNILTLLVEFDGEDEEHVGPLHNEISPPAQDDNTTLWVEDFDRTHYQDMLFDMRPGARSMSNYFLEQSGRTYTVDGETFGWVAVPHSEWFYGADYAWGDDDLNGPVWRVVEDAVAAAGCDVPWAQFDNEDPYDLDFDGDFDEPDGYVDHIQLVHAGVGQEAGGGVQGDDSIWSHSWWADFGYDGPGYGGVPTCDPNVWVGPYTINPEDGAIGVFCHEFTHDLGVPDLYDTIYSGQASTGFWSLMAGGSWLGCPDEPLGTCPSGLGVWEKYLLDWVDPIVVNPGEIDRNVYLRMATSPGPANKALLVNLPDYDYGVSLDVDRAGSYWYSSQGNNLSHTLARVVAVPEGGVLSFETWYDIETDWDYGYVEVSLDGLAWTTLPGYDADDALFTTDDNPNGSNQGNGITGVSGGWFSASFDLSEYGGQTVLLRFRYETDAYVANPGWLIDDIAINGFYDDVEAGNQGWTEDGWYIITDGAALQSTYHYYLVEWRTPDGFDVSMTNWYNFVSGNYAEFISATPGMLVWYRDGQYADNWAGEHPWAGMVLLVDAHPDLFIQDVLSDLWGYPLPFSTYYQLFDAAFGTDVAVEGQVLSDWYGVQIPTLLPVLDAVPTFDDSLIWADRSFEWFLPYALCFGQSCVPVWVDAISSVETPSYGLTITVDEALQNGARVTVDFSGYANP